MVMRDKKENEKRKKILDELRQKAAEQFESSLPMSRDRFKMLFDYLDTELSEKDCDDTNRLTKAFLNQADVQNADEILTWLAENGGYCDCEILANVEELFE